MNLSGNAVRQFMSFYNVDIDDLLVIQDDLDLTIGTYKLKKNSSAGGHNGIKSIIANLGTEKFIKVRIGIKDDKPFISQIDFVLMKYSPDELKEQKKNIDRAVDAVISVIKNGIDKTMNDFNAAQQGKLTSP